MLGDDLLFSATDYSSAHLLALNLGGTFVLGELPAEAFLRLGCPLERLKWDFERPAAMGTGANGGYGTDPFLYAKVSCPHVSVSHRFL